MAREKKTDRAHAQISLALDEPLPLDRADWLKISSKKMAVDRTATMASTQQEFYRRMMKKTKAFLRDRRCANNITEIMSHLETKKTSELITTMKFIRKIYLHVLSENLMVLKDTSDKLDKAQQAEKHYRLWLQKNYDKIKRRLLSLLHHKVKSVQSSAMKTLLSFFICETKKPLRNTLFPEQFFQDIITACLSENNMVLIIHQFDKHLQYHDVVHFLLKTLRSSLNVKTCEVPSEGYLKNFLCFLEMIFENGENLIPSSEEDGSSDKYLSCSKEIGKDRFPSSHRQELCNIWQRFLSLKLSFSLYKRVLILLPNKVLPLFDNPRVLTDFLTESYNIGGLVSLLALNGLFVLIKDYNLEYPQFYVHLYNLLSPEMFFVKFRGRFLQLLHTALCSTHLPEYLIIAFVKKLIRLSLLAPVESSNDILLFLSNLMVCHTNLLHLIDSDSSKPISLHDPYVDTETDPNKCHAVDSSLWEIQSLQSHYSSVIAKAANRIRKAKSSKTNNLTPFSLSDKDDMMEEEFAMEFNDCSLAQSASLAMFSQNDGIMQNLWICT